MPHAHLGFTHIDTILLLAVLAAVSVGYVIGRSRLHHFQNAGERRLSRAIIPRFLAPDYHLLNHLSLPVEGGTTQIDHVLVSKFGIFVIETKHFGGWIYGGQNDRHWTQVIFRKKSRFQDPIRQNRRHVLAVRKLLDFLPRETIHSAVVFTADAKFKTAVPDGPFALEQFLTQVQRYTTETLSHNRVQFCVGRLETARLALTKMTDVQHVQRLRNRIGKHD